MEKNVRFQLELTQSLEKGDIDHAKYVETSKGVHQLLDELSIDEFMKKAGGEHGKSDK